ncbi:protein BEAN1 isoform X2 [Spea bombifrons]|uniref:protein BEAN1 isoform X2 n=1 Tax=Spea bombifrons TaxID=233779 RepID=UPI0023493C5E|nr:protein BEAN1 isoform X2 [Spea bombifrons]
MSIKLTCTKIQANQSNGFPEYFGYIRSANDPSLLVSPMVVAGIVIGLVLFLSCMTIIIGSLRKDGGVRDLHADPSYDGISYAAPIGDLRSVCSGDRSPSFEFGSNMEFNFTFLDAPPRYDDCVRPEASAVYIPPDDPPPYSLEDPCLARELAFDVSTEEVPWTSLENTGPPVTSNDVSSVGHQALPPYRTLHKENVHIPLTPTDSLKDVSSRNLPVPQQNA